MPAIDDGRSEGAAAYRVEKAHRGAAEAAGQPSDGQRAASQ